MLKYKTMTLRVIIRFLLFLCIHTLLAGCTITSYTIRPDTKARYKQDSYPGKLKVRFFRYPEKKNDSLAVPSYNSNAILQQAFASPLFEINSFSGLKVSYRTVSADEDNPFFFALYCLTLGVLPRVGDTNSKVEFRLSGARTGELIKTYKFQATGAYWNSWLLIPSALPLKLIPNLETVYGIDAFLEFPQSLLFNRFEKSFLNDLNEDPAFRAKVEEHSRRLKWRIAVLGRNLQNDRGQARSLALALEKILRSENQDVSNNLSLENVSEAKSSKRGGQDLLKLGGRLQRDIVIYIEDNSYQYRQNQANDADTGGGRENEESAKESRDFIMRPAVRLLAVDVKKRRIVLEEFYPLEGDGPAQINGTARRILDRLLMAGVM